jgi:acetylornithine deacetylase
MKGFIASVLAAVPTLISMPLTRPIHIVLTYDEEIDCAGMREFLETSEAVNLAPQAVILGEPTDMELVIGHRGHYRFETIIRGSQAHGGNAWQGANAIAVAGELISYLYSHYPGLQATDPASAAGTTSINVGIIEGGELFNIVAGNCRIEWELRPALGVDGEAIIEEFERHCREVESVHANRGAPLGVETAVLESYPEYRHEPESAVVALVRSLTAVSDPTIVGYGTEAPFYQERGMPVVIMGPGSINQAHQPNEYTEITQLHACTAFIQALAQHVAA